MRISPNTDRVFCGIDARFSNTARLQRIVTRLGCGSLRHLPSGVRRFPARQPYSNFLEYRFIMSRMIVLAALGGLLLNPLAVLAEPAPAAVTPAFSHDSLHALLRAEFAISRNQAADALAPYRDQALATRDRAVLERALQIANYLQDSKEGLVIATALSDTVPAQSGVWYQAAYHALREQDADRAINALSRLLDLDPEAELEALFLSAYPATPEGRTRMIEAIGGLESQHPGNGHLQFARALLAGENGAYAEAITHIRQARSRMPDSIPALLLHARLLGMNHQETEALDLLSDAVMKYPNSRQVNLHYARILIKTGHPYQAESRLKQLLANSPNDEEILLMHGLLAYNNQHDADARQSLDRLALTGEHADEARYYLALIARRQQNPDLAETHLESISEGRFFIAALSELSDLLASQDRLEEARRNLVIARQSLPEQAAMIYVIEAEMLNKRKQSEQAFLLLNEALNRFPQDNTLLFARALTSDKLKKLPQFEKDMQELLARDPGNASYLNALGYTLADQTQRFGEADVYLRQAYQLKPDDPAIIDSMGWLYYRLGNVTQALEYIQKAFNLYPDEEIGLHLAELLWVTGKQAEAEKVWRQLLRKNPDSEMVLKHKAKFEQKP